LAKVSRIPAKHSPQDVKKLLQILRKFALPWRALTIGIDGRMGAGKSTVGRFLAWQLGMPIVETDMWMLRRHIPIGYRYRQLKVAISHRHKICRPILIEGVKLLETLEVLKIQCDFLIWVKSADDPADAEEIAEILGSETRVADVEKYICSYRPQARAQYIINGFAANN
jgi:hypothetical protein